MDVRPLGAGEREAFDGFLAAHPWGDLLQTWAWGDLKARSGWRPLRVGGFEDGRLVAATSLLLRKLPYGLPKSIGYASRGPTFAETRHLTPFLEGLERVAKKEGAFLLKVDPPVRKEERDVDAAFRARGYLPNEKPGFGGEQPRCNMILPLAGRTEDEILAGFKQKWRYNIRLAEKKGVEVTLDAPREDLAAFHALYRTTATRDGFTGRPLAYFEAMWDLLHPRGEAYLTVARYEGTPIAAAINTRIGDRETYLYGASSNEHRNVMAPHLVQWRMIRRALEDGKRLYDFRGVSPKTGESDAHLEGLNRFKEGFAAEFVEYVGEYDLPLSPFWYALWEKALPRLRGK